MFYGVFCRILSVPHTLVTDLNNIMHEASLIDCLENAKSLALGKREHGNSPRYTL